MNNPFRRISIEEQILFAKHLAVMTKAGMPLLDSLGLIKKQINSRIMGKIIDQAIKDVSNGQFLSTSLEKYRNFFGDFTINLIKVGETSGILYENLSYLAEELKKKRELRTKVLGALTYPAIVLFVAIGIIGVLTLYVFPKILPILTSLKSSPPITTRILILVSSFLVAYGLFIAVGLSIFTAISWLLITRVKSIKFLFHYLILGTPLVNRISKNYNLATFSRTLGLLLKSDIKIVEALSITADTMTNLVYQKEVKNISLNVSRGEEISKHLEAKTRLFPLTLSQMITIGERTGNLSESLLYLAELYENELDDLTKNLSSTLEPLLMVVLGVIVGFIALSIITPIYQVTQHI